MKKISKAIVENHMGLTEFDQVFAMAYEDVPDILVIPKESIDRKYQFIEVHATQEDIDRVEKQYHELRSQYNHECFRNAVQIGENAKQYRYTIAINLMLINGYPMTCLQKSR